MRVSFFTFASVALMLLSAWNARAQSIYAGGNGDGFSVSNFAQPDNILYNIYAGGIQDGSATSSFAQPDNVLFDIYKGGTEDGFSVSSFAQPDNVLFDIYKGGTEDGFSVSSFAQPDNVLFDIYKGGAMDGFSVSSFAQPDNVLFDIYKGGIGDGFAFNNLGSVGSEVPLPVELVSFEGKYRKGAIFITWKTESEINNERFVLERSATGLSFNSLYSVDGSGTSTTPREYNYEDKRPLPGVNYYRLKQVDFDQKYTYSSIIAVEATDQPGPPLILFPNPSHPGDRIQIRMEGVVQGSPVLVTIRTVSGMEIQSFEAIVDELNQITINPKVSSQIASGFYLVSVQISNGLLVTKWIVK